MQSITPMPLTEQQRNALPSVRTRFRNLVVPATTAASFEQRTRLPDPAHLPANVTVRLEIAPPSPHPLLDVRLRAPERVPVYFYTIGTEKLDPGHTRVLLFIHGGANVVGHPADALNPQFFASLLRAARVPYVLVAPCYRLATVPENAFPAAVQDLVAAYDHVLAQGYSPSNVVLAGNSAGGNHAIVLTHLLLRAGRPAPRGVIAIAPFSLQARALMSEYARSQADNDVTDTSTMDDVVKMYIGDSGLEPTDPLISGAYLPIYPSWPKTLILVGSADQIIDGSRVLAKRLTDAQRPVELVEYDELPHVWWVLPDVFPGEIQDAAQRIAQFVLAD